VAANPHLRGGDLETAVATIFNEIASMLARGDRVELRGFGAFTVRRREAYVGRDPRTGELVSVRETSTAFFRAGKDLRRRVDAGKALHGRQRPDTEQAHPAVNAPVRIVT
jgi:integration host factor subunit beta